MGGAKRLCLTICKELNNRGHDIKIIIFNNSSLKRYIGDEFIPLDNFDPYYKLSFNKGSGNIKNTELLLSSISSRPN